MYITVERTEFNLHIYAEISVNEYIKQFLNWN